MRPAAAASACLLLIACSGDSAPGDDDDSSGDADAAVVPCGTDEPLHSGEATYYAADGSGNCSFDPSPDDLLVAAMNQPDYGGSAVCGACAAVDGPNGSVTVRIVDRCPECAQGDLDLSPEAFGLIADLAAGRVPISWRFVPCDLSGPVRYHFKDGSNPYWTAIQIRNHRHAIASLEADKGGTWQSIPRESYNYFVDTAGLGDGPYSLRITDVHGQVLEDTGIPLGDNTEVEGAAQFPACP